MIVFHLHLRFCALENRLNCLNEFDIGQTIFLIALRSWLRDIQILNTPEDECQEESKPSARQRGWGLFSKRTEINGFP
jgi:hypothetical protein